MGPERSALRRVSANMDVFGVPIKSDDTLTATSRRIPSQPLDISSANGFDLLSDAEQQLCSSLHIYPMAYIAIKEQLITENISKGFVKRRQLRNLLKIETTKSMKIYDFMIKNGWIFNKRTS